ncbi:hypothetical protein ACFV2H_51030 [Streptomyces sp. NPDC059629]|uniref:hypothetical protein n=1 Tax=Streptomyces sp. NPDC059629 TaxID=3346889 RepID=UPI00368DF7A8
MEQLSRQQGWKLVSLTKASCKTAGITIVNNHRPYKACDTRREHAPERIAHLEPMPGRGLLLQGGRVGEGAEGPAAGLGGGL